MSYVAYLKLEGIAGDCSDAAHRGWMTVDSFSQCLSGPQERGGGTQLSDVAINKVVDRSTPLLARATVEGRHFKEAVLELCRNEEAKPRFMEIRLTNVRISSYGVVGTPQIDGRMPIENIMLNYERIEWLYVSHASVPGPEKEPVVCKTAWVTDAKAAV